MLPSGSNNLARSLLCFSIYCLLHFGLKYPFRCCFKRRYLLPRASGFGLVSDLWWALQAVYEYINDDLLLSSCHVEYIPFFNCKNVFNLDIAHHLLVVALRLSYP